MLMKQYKYPRELLDKIKSREKTATGIFRSAIDDVQAAEMHAMVNQLVEVTNDDEPGRVQNPDS
jgi:hypothetical protein